MKPPPPLPLLHMSQLDLNGVLFVEFPSDWPLDRSRLALERLVRRCGYVELDPATIYAALAMERRRNLLRLPKEVLDRKIAEAWERRRASHPQPPKPPPKPKPTPPPNLTGNHPKPKINIEDWSF